MCALSSLAVLPLAAPVIGVASRGARSGLKLFKTGKPIGSTRRGNATRVETRLDEGNKIYQPNDDAITILDYNGRNVRGDKGYSGVKGAENVKKVAETEHMYFQPRRDEVRLRQFAHKDKKGFSFAEYVDPAGNKYYVRFSHKDGTYQFIKPGEAPFKSRLLTRKTKISSLPPAPKITDSNVTQMAESMAQRQALASSTLRTKSDGIEGLTAANKQMIKIVKSNAELKVSDIEQFNYKIQGAEAPYSGVIRGSDKVFRDAQTWVVKQVDATDVWVVAGGNGNRFTYASPDDVPKLMNDWLNKANALTSQDSVQDIAELHQQFIMIHPFSDGNGRTSRLVLDYMLLKTGREPFRHSKSTSGVLFLSPAELAEKMTRQMLTRQ